MEFFYPGKEKLKVRLIHKIIFKSYLNKLKKIFIILLLFALNLSLNLQNWLSSLILTAESHYLIFYFSLKYQSVIIKKNKNNYIIK